MSSTTRWSDLPAEQRRRTLSRLEAAIAGTEDMLARKKAFATAHPDIERAQARVVEFQEELTALEALREYAEGGSK